MSKQSDLVSVSQGASGDPLFIDTANDRVGVGTSSPAVRLHATGNGIITRLSGSGGDYHGLQIQCSDASGSATKNIFFDALNESGAAVANMLGQVQSDGGSHWSWSTQPPGARTDRRVERLRIDGAGRVTMPYQPSFLARGGSNAATSGARTFLFDTIDHNIGGHYSSATGRFTAPVSGIYLFEFHLFADDANQRYLSVLQKNGGGMQEYTQEQPTAAATGQGYASLDGKLIMQLSANDYIEVQAVPSCLANPLYNSFSGRLLG